MRDLVQKMVTPTAGAQHLPLSGLEAQPAAPTATPRSQVDLRDALNAAGAGSWELCLEGRVATSTCHSELYALATVRFGEVLGEIHPEDIGPASAALDEHMAGLTETYDAAYRIRTERGWVWVGDRGKIIEWGRHQQPLRMAGIVQDISKLKSIEADLRLHACVFENTADGIFITDQDLRIFEANSEFLKLLGLTQAEVIGTNLCEHLLDKSSRRMKDEIDQDLLLSGRWSKRVKVRGNAESQLTAEITINEVEHDSSGSYRLVGVCTDVSDSVQTERELWRAANFDALTGLPNRGLFSDMLARACKQARQDQSIHALMFIDLDRFKNVNDSLGHAAGDSLLRMVADRMRGTLRTSDDPSVPPSFARLGGDEFAALLSNIRDSDAARRVAERLLKSLAEPYRLDGQEVTVTPSIGIAICPQHSDQADRLLKLSDTAMYFAKNAGRGVFRFYTRDLEQKKNERVTLEAAIDHAIENNEIENFYQPIVDFQSKRIVGVEALARWTHKGQPIPPDRFIPVAEDTGQILGIGETSLRQACQHLRRLLSGELIDSDFTMSVNLSPVQFRRPDIAQTIKQIVDSEQIPAEMIQLEITESAILDPIESAIETMHQLIGMGFRLAIDDFGVGHSSLGHLKRFPVTTLKIDRSFVSEIDTSEQDLGVIHGIVSLAKALALRLTAEGVETEEQRACLADTGCNNWQGWLCSPAIPIDRLEEAVRKKNLPTLG